MEELSFGMGILITIVATLVGGVFILPMIGSYLMSCIAASIITAILFIISGEYLFGLGIIALYILLVVVVFIKTPRSYTAPHKEVNHEGEDSGCLVPLILFICFILFFITIVVSYL